MHTISILAVCSLALVPAHAASSSTSSSPDVRLIPRRPRLTEARIRTGKVPQLVVVVDKEQECPLSRRSSKGDGQRERKRAMPGNGTGIIQHLTTEANVYIVNLTLGTPPTTYPFQLDTASSDLLIASSLCTSSSCPDLASTPRYYSGRSSSYSSVNSNTTGFNLTYSDGSQASGFLGLETLTIPGSSSGGQVTVSQQVVGIMNQTTLDLAALGVSGIVGLGFPRLSALLRASLKEATEEPATTTTTAIRGGYTSQSSQISSTTAESTSTTEIFFSILPIETITPLTSIPTTFPTSTSTSLVRRATAAAEETNYYPPLLESLFGHPSISSSPHLAYPIFSIALANTSAAYSTANDAASITWGGVSSAYVSATSGNSSFAGRTVDDVDWVEVVPFGRATTAAVTNTTPGGSSSGRFDVSSLEDEAYLYWSIPLLSVSVNGTALSLEPTYNASFTGIEEPIALLDIGTNGIYAPQQAVISLFSRIKDARQVSDGQWAVPCSTRATMTFLLGPKTLVELQPSEWMYARVGGGSSMCLAWPVVAPPSADGVDWQLGTPVLRKVYSIFSYGIDGAQPPLMGFLPLPAPATVNASASSAAVSASTIIATYTVSRNLSEPTATSVQDVAEISSLITSTIATALPNALLPNPSHTTPPYAFLTTGPVPTLGQVQSNGLANPLVYSINDVPVITASLSASSGSSGIGSSTQTRTSAARASGSGQTNGASGGAGSTAAATSGGRRKVPEMWVSIGTNIGLAGLAGCLLLVGRL
ncbi:hypothetical protein QFC22_004226 [Naganishia vaughanmartiniae]|uniref:Uncharacterized protein n=1 Tax=Naganishia vaughanmartiniae TaxID=1424756 RepID=A0ACC2X2P1_9TREE|nr:hypothetical protein QFC22_004226 [Naganishia vaughanmartiniae]